MQTSRRRCAIAPIFKYHPSPLPPLSFPPFVTRFLSFLHPDLPLLSSPGGRRKKERKEGRETSFARLISNETFSLSLSLSPFAYANYRSRDPTFLTGEKRTAVAGELSAEAREFRAAEEARVTRFLDHLSRVEDDRSLVRGRNLFEAELREIKSELKGTELRIEKGC